MKKQLALIHEINNKIQPIKLFCSAGDCGYQKRVITAYDATLLLLKELNEEIVHQEAIKLSVTTMQSRYENLEIHLEEISQGLEIQLIKTCPPEVEFFGDIPAARLAVANIIGNAKKAGATKLIWEYIEKNRFVEVHMSDNGEGMTEEVLEKIGFGYSTHHGGKGIAIIRDACHAAGGTVEWKSIRHVGTCVIVKLRKVLN